MYISIYTIHIYIYVCIYIYIYIYIYRAQDCTPELTKGKFHGNMSLTIHRTFLVKIHWESDSPLENTSEQWNYVGKYH